MACGNDLYYCLTLNLMGKYDPSNTMQIHLTNRPIKNDPNCKFIPLLKSISGFGLKLNDYFPSKISAKASIDNSISSFAHNKRFSDLLCEYTISAQPITLAFGQTETCEDSDCEPQFDNLWGGIVESVSFNASSESFEISMRYDWEDKKYIAEQEITTELYPDAPDSSLGKFVPLVLGSDRQVKPIVVKTHKDNINGNSFQYGQKWAYQTTFGDNTYANWFDGGGVKEVLVRQLEGETDEERKYYKVTSRALSEVQPVNFVQGDIMGNGNSTILGFPRVPNVGTQSRNNQRWYYPINFDPNNIDNPKVIYGGQFLIQGNGSGEVAVDDGDELIFRVYPMKADGSPDWESSHIAEAKVPLFDLGQGYAPSWIMGDQQYPVQFYFDRLVPINSREVNDGQHRGYFLSFTSTGQKPDSPNRIKVPTWNTQGTHLNRYRTVEDPEDSHPDHLKLRGQRSAHFGFYACYFDELGIEQVNTDGLGARLFQLRYNALGTGTQPEDSNLDIILEVDGLIDSTGSVTGTTGQLIDQTHNQVDTLLHRFNPLTNNWEGGYFEKNCFLHTHSQYNISGGWAFGRTTSGSTEGRVFNTELIKQLARDSYSRLAYVGVGNQKLGLYADGVPETDLFTLTDDDLVTFEKFTINDLKSIINKVSMAYDRRYDVVEDFEDEQQKEYRGFGKILNMNYNDSGIGQTLALDSYKLFGTKELKEDKYKWLADDISANSVARLMLSQHDLPNEYITFRIVLHKFLSLKPLDVLLINSTLTPSCSGSNPDYFVDIENNCDSVSGLTNYSAQQVRVQINNLTYDLPFKGLPTIKITGRLLIHINDPI